MAHGLDLVETEQAAAPAASAGGGSNWVTVGVTPATTQCQKPLPVGASGSYTVMAKLLASLGAPLQLRDGEMLPPLQPKTFAT